MTKDKSDNLQSENETPENELTDDKIPWEYSLDKIGQGFAMNWTPPKGKKRKSEEE